MKAPAGQLRSIAVTVREREPGVFDWVLLELADGDAWIDLEVSPTAAKTYRQAMADGLLALQSLTGDLDAGPRMEVPEGGNAEAKGSHAFFGFGPI